MLWSASRSRSRYTEHIVEILHRSQRVASHRRSRVTGNASTCPEHRPQCHRRYLEWSPSRLISWAAKIGPHCGDLVEKMLASRRYPEQAYRSCLGLLRLGKTFGEDRLEAGLPAGPGLLHLLLPERQVHSQDGSGLPAITRNPTTTTGSRALQPARSRLLHL